MVKLSLIVIKMMKNDIKNVKNMIWAKIKFQILNWKSYPLTVQKQNRMLN